MATSPPTSIILPTTEWTSACAEVGQQLGPRDELLVVCDDEADAVAERSDLTAGVRLVYAGEPVGCSGKANAIAAGMDAAHHDRIVWTDDDFHHPSGWLTQLHAAYEDHGPVTEVPIFAGRDPLAILLEPTYVVGGTLGVYAGDIAWGGAVMFDRSDLDVDAFLHDLRQTVSDDGLLSEHLSVTPLRRVRCGPVGGSLRATAERHVRFTQIVRWHDPVGFVGMLAIATVSTIAALLFPLGGRHRADTAPGGDLRRLRDPSMDVSLGVSGDTRTGPPVRLKPHSADLRLGWSTLPLAVEVRRGDRRMPAVSAAGTLARVGSLSALTPGVG